jgi:hypothetical protein
VSAAEIEHGLVTVSPDFEPLSMLADNEPYDQLLDGEPLVEIFPDLDGLADRGMPVNAIQDAPAFLLPPDRLWTLGLRAGDLVGFRVTAAGMDLARVDEGDVEADVDGCPRRA